MALKLIAITSLVHFPTMSHIRRLAFSSNPLNGLMFGSVSPPLLEEWFLEREKRDATNRHQRIIGVMDGEKLVAYAKWEIPVDLSEDVIGGKESRTHVVEIPKRPEGANDEVWREFRGGIDGMRGRWSDHERDFALHTLAVHPDYKRRGCGSMLVKWGVEKADDAGRKCYLESTPAAYPLYQKFGWADVDEIVLDLGKYGKGKHKIKIMMREPKVETRQ